jgi:molecular chaperone GrpE
LTPDAVATVLADFQSWLTGLIAAENDGEATPGQGAEEPIDLHTLLGQFLAVRHEVNLQTRAVRAQQEQNAETLRQLTAALDALRQAQIRTEQFQEREREEAIRPLLQTFVDLHDALALAGREMQRMQVTIQPALEQLGSATEPESPAPRSFWVRLFRPSAPMNVQNEKQTARQAIASGERVRQFLASLATGYTMSLQRVERALRQHGLEAISVAGGRFDPELMEVLEAVTGSGRPSGEVIEEVRRGYLWNGRVFRFAQVRVAKG